MEFLIAGAILVVAIRIIVAIAASRRQEKQLLEHQDFLHRVEREAQQRHHEMTMQRLRSANSNEERAEILSKSLQRNSQDYTVRSRAFLNEVMGVYGMPGIGSPDDVTPTWVYLIERPAFGQQKIGITTNPSKRIQIDHASNGWTLRDSHGPVSWRLAKDFESRFLQHLDSRGVRRGQAAWGVPFDGYTEAWSTREYSIIRISDSGLLLP